MAEIGEIKTADRVIDILHPGTKEPLGISVTLVHIDDPVLKRIKRKITDDRLRLEQRGKSLKAEDLEENKNNILFGAMKDWNWGRDSDGEQNMFHGEIPEFSKRNVVAVFEEISWFAEQVHEAVLDTEAFFDKSKRN